MNKTKEEVLQPHISTYQSDNGESDFDFIWPENASKAMDEYTTHLTDQIKSMEKQAVLDLDTIVNQRAIIKSMENYISDVDGQVKEFREGKKNYEDHLDEISEKLINQDAKLESLQKELERTKAICSHLQEKSFSLQSQLTTSEVKLKEYAEWTHDSAWMYEGEGKWYRYLTPAPSDEIEWKTTQELYEQFKSTLTN